LPALSLISVIDVTHQPKMKSTIFSEK
jgi:hypothetical protein